ncbi:hypothetical protein [Sphingomonas melonis]|uniref:hypothetical protein n=1 Tax=Sphingomonas melonis TaxID=152682 RepID=UPI0036740C57
MTAPIQHPISGEGGLAAVYKRVLPEGEKLVFAYKVFTRGSRQEHQWSLVGERGGIHVDAWLCSGAADYRDDRWIGGIEGHSPTPRDYDSAKPSHEHCWLIQGPCWHDGSSLQFSEQIAPYLPMTGEVMTDREHEDVLRTMRSRYHSWLPEAATAARQQGEGA